MRYKIPSKKHSRNKYKICIKHDLLDTKTKIIICIATSRLLNIKGKINILFRSNMKYDLPMHFI